MNKNTIIETNKGLSLSGVRFFADTNVRIYSRSLSVFYLLGWSAYLWVIICF